MKSRFYRITEFSKKTGLTVKALRIYDRSGILTPLRSDNQYRHYSEEQVALAKDILKLKLTGFSLQEIKALLPFRDQSEQGTLTLLRQQLLKTEQTLSALSEQRTQLKLMIQSVQQQEGGKSKKFSGILVQRLICTQISESIKKLSEKQLLQKTKDISNEDYLRTVAMVDNVAQAKLLSVISIKAAQSVKNDLAKLEHQYAKFWK